jgi:hypothetical protein
LPSEKHFDHSAGNRATNLLPQAAFSTMSIFESWTDFFAQANLAEDEECKSMIANLQTERAQPDADFFEMVLDPSERPAFLKAWKAGPLSKFLALGRKTFRSAAAARQDAPLDDDQEVRLLLSPSAKKKNNLQTPRDANLRSDPSLYRSKPRPSRKGVRGGKNEFEPERLAVFRHRRAIFDHFRLALALPGRPYVFLVSSSLRSSSSSHFLLLLSSFSLCNASRKFSQLPHCHQTQAVSWLLAAFPKAAFSQKDAEEGLFALLTCSVVGHCLLLFCSFLPSFLSTRPSSR